MKVGDKVIRNMCGLKMTLEITEIDDQLIHCGPWTFDKNTKGEVDLDLGWDGIKVYGSFLEDVV